MTRLTYNTHGPLDRATDWRDYAACRNEDPDLFFPKGTDGPWALQIEQAKAVCRRCPALEACLLYAYEANPSDGIFGGLTEAERRSLRRRSPRAGRLTPLHDTPPEPEPATLEEAFQRRTQRTDDGHVLWLGAMQMKFQGEKLNPLRVAFQLGHGREPEGRVQRTCGRACLAPAHLTDSVIRDSEAVCGTRRGYQRHRRHGEVACGPCRQANTDADNRLRRTGTTKAAA
jgi:hypothetical protein